MHLPGPLVSTQWLAERLGAPDLTILDASWYMPAERRDPAAEFLAAHIPGAGFFDIDALSDRASDLPHMLAPEADFAAQAGALGMADGRTVVFYDGAGIFSAPRGWWCLRAMGHEAVAVLDGGLPKWRREGRALDGGPAASSPARFAARRNPALIRDLAQMKDNLTRRSELVLDARGSPRFAGTEAEPRPGLRSGHIPGSRNVHYAKLLTPDGTMKPPEALRALFAAANIPLDAKLVTSCGSGITAAILLLALELAGAKSAALYDGSWSEWGARADLPVETGP
jgi:thiosulfate/3-mercaptopyruvate sulfurtransferase